MEKTGCTLSPLCRAITHDGYTIFVQISRSDLSGWTLGVVDARGNSTVWMEQFESDRTALDAAHRAILEEGISAFVGPTVRIGF